MKSLRHIFLVLLFVRATTGHLQMFTEVSDGVGLSYIYPGNDNQDVGAGITILDVNNDGWEDFFQAGGVFQSKLWLNKKGRFIDVTEQFRMQCLDSLFIQGAVSGDFNNDGFTDLFICNFGIGMRMGDDKCPVLLKNVGGEYFEPVFTNVFKEPGNYTSATWGDYNRDGFIDLLLTNYVYRMNNISDSTGKEIGYDPICLENKFYKNLQGNGFVELSKQFNLNNDGCGLASAFTDFDDDGDLDLMVLNDFAEWNHKGNLLYRNEFPADSFTEISHDAGFDAEMFGMGIGPGDYDNDGDKDYYITNIGQNRFYQNMGDGNLKDIAKELNIDLTWANDSLRGTSWSGVFLDFDNDMDLDLYVAKGNVRALTPETVIADPNKLFENMEGKKFIDVSNNSGVDDILSHRGTGLLDFDHDGDIDIISGVIKMHWSAFGNMEQKIKLFRNNNHSKNHWIGIKLVGDLGTNTDALGSQVRILVNGIVQVREVDGGSGHGSQSSKILYFGIGEFDRVDQISIQWSSGKQMEVNNLREGHVYKIYESGKRKKLY